MKAKITKREFQIMALYSKGLTFREMAQCLGIAERTAINYLMRVKAKENNSITKAKPSREKNKLSYKIRLKDEVRTIKAHNRETKRYALNDAQISIKKQSKIFRLFYLNECLLFTHQSYNEMKLKSLKKFTQK
jgi:transposase